MKRQAGFTLIELVVVIIILGILAATALPRFMNVQDKAHKAAVEGVSGSLGSGIAMLHAQWMANGGSGAVVDVAGFGQGDLDVNAAGWPVGTDGGDRVADTDDCIDLWNGLLQNPPGVSASAGSDYRVTRSDQVCTYTYQGDSGTTRSIAYDASTGNLTVTNP